MTDNTFSESFRLSTGGLFYNILIRLHVQASGRYSTKRRILVLTTLCWLPLFLLAAYEGILVNQNLDLPFLYDLKPYVRYLIVVPLLIVADMVIDPMIASNLQSIGSSGLIEDKHENEYKNAVEHLKRRKDSHLADIVIMLVVASVSISFIANLGDLDAANTFTNWSMTLENQEPKLTYAGWWFILVSSPIIQIILFRWFWRFYLWAEFLFRVSRLKLRLQPTHPDLAGGLGILENGEYSFILLFVAFGALLSVSLAEEILYGEITLIQAQPIIAIYIAFSVLVMVLPLAFFTGHLIIAKRRGRVVYGGLGYRLSQAFDKKWGNPDDKASGKKLLDTADASAVCDYSDVYEAVREMRYMPIRIKDLAGQVIVLAAPFIPLIFIEVPVTEVLRRLIDVVI